MRCLTNDGTRRLYGDSVELPFEFQYGHYGVEAFFVLSGYVIYQSLEGKPSAFEFARARCMRLYPTFWLCLAISVGIVMTVYPWGNRDVSLVSILANATMLPRQLLGIAGP
ncbi:acyltransferase family protein [Planctomycetaceae bacterium SH139]